MASMLPSWMPRVRWTVAISNHRPFSLTDHTGDARLWERFIECYHDASSKLRKRGARYRKFLDLVRGYPQHTLGANTELLKHTLLNGSMEFYAVIFDLYAEHHADTHKVARELAAACIISLHSDPWDIYPELMERCASLEPIPSGITKLEHAFGLGFGGYRRTLSWTVCSSYPLATLLEHLGQRATPAMDTQHILALRIFADDLFNTPSQQDCGPLDHSILSLAARCKALAARLTAHARTTLTDKATKDALRDIFRKTSDFLMFYTVAPVFPD